MTRPMSICQTLITTFRRPAVSPDNYFLAHPVKAWAHWQGVEVVYGVAFLLPPIGIQGLLEIALWYSIEPNPRPGGTSKNH